jgi:HlyD family secretion protein
MTATITVKTREAHNVLTIPNAALRYQPSTLGADGKPVPQTPLPSLAKGKARVYLPQGQPGDEKSDIKIIDTGVTDGIRTEIASGLDVGSRVITDETDDDKKKKKGFF